MEEWLQSLVPWGTEFLVWLQSYSSNAVEALFRLFTILGNEEFYLFLLPVVYWCVHKRIGMGLAYMAMISVWLNDVVKYLFRIPRPADPRLQVRWPETSPSFPSGHSQSAVTNWGYLAIRFRNRLFTIMTIVLILGTSLSRMVLGVHFPQDLVGGWIIGLLLLFVFTRAEPHVEAWLKRQTTTMQVAVAIAFPLLLIFLHPADLEGLYPAEGAITPGAALVGTGIGIIMERNRVRFTVDGTWARRLVRLAVGLVIVVAVYAAPKLLLPDEILFPASVLVRFLRFVAIGWVTTFFCPWLFVRLGLAGQGPAVTKEPGSARASETISLAN